MPNRLSFVQGPNFADDAKPAGFAPVGDYYAWAQEQAALIRSGRFECVDRLNVAEEIEDLGKSEFRAFASNLEIILTHILKWDHQTTRRSRSWSDSIFEHRLRILRLLDDSPSLKARQDDAISRVYGLARVVAARQTKLDLARFPDICPYTWTDIMEAPYELPPPKARRRTR